MTKRFLYHNRGVQCVRFSADCRYILSIGNIKDGKIAVFEAGTETVAASALEIFPMHEAKWRNGTVKGVGRRTEYEFTLAGRNNLTVWRFSEDDRMIRKQTEKFFTLLGKERDVTALEYINSANNGVCIAAGLESGDFFVFKASGLEQLYELQFFSKEVSTISFCPIFDRLVATSLDGVLLILRFNDMLGPDFDLDVDAKQIRFDSGITACSFDQDFEEGIIATIDAGIKYVSLKDRKFGDFVQGVDPINPVTNLLLLNEDIILTIHRLGDAKMWSSNTGEILKELKWKEMVFPGHNLR